MKEHPRWREAQECETEFWDGMAKSEHNILRVLADNAEKAPTIRSAIRTTPQSCLEVGIGPFGLGVLGFLPEIPFRVAMDPLVPTPMDSDGLLRRFIQTRRSTMRYVMGRGEEIPLRDESMDLVVWCNVIDHVSLPEAILREIRRVLKPGGFLFLDVHTLSVAGLLKWHLWTKFAHRDEILVKAHPYRMWEAGIRRKLRSHGFAVQKLAGHTFLSACIGHCRTSTFLGVRHSS